MKHKLVVTVLIGGALVAAFLIMDGENSHPNGTLQQTAESPSPDELIIVSKKILDVTTGVSEVENEVETQKGEAQASQPVDDTVNSPKWPDEIENLILDHLSRLDRFTFTAIKSVECDAHECEILFSGLDSKPTTVGNANNVIDGMFLPPINAQTGMVGTREIVAGAREYVIRISNVPYVEPPRDK